MNQSFIYQLPHGYFNGRIAYNISPTITTSSWENNNLLVEIMPNNNSDKVIEVGNIANTWSWSSPQHGRIYSIQGCAPTLNTCGGGGHEPKIIVCGNFNPKEVADSDEVNNTIYNSTKDSLVLERIIEENQTIDVNMQEPFNTDNEGNAKTLLAGYYKFGKATMTRAKGSTGTGVCVNYRIRKLTPRECFRLMDVTEEDIDKIQNAGISNSQQYKMAGNSIVAACMVGIFDNLFNGVKNKTTLF